MINPDTRAQRLVDEFEEAATDWEGEKYNIRHGIAGYAQLVADRLNGVER